MTIDFFGPGSCHLAHAPTPPSISPSTCQVQSHPSLQSLCPIRSESHQPLSCSFKTTKSMAAEKRRLSTVIPSRPQSNSYILLKHEVDYGSGSMKRLRIPGRQEPLFSVPIPTVSCLSLASGDMSFSWQSHPPPITLVAHFPVIKQRYEFGVPLHGCSPHSISSRPSHRRDLPRHHFLCLISTTRYLLAWLATSWKPLYLW